MSSSRSDDALGVEAAEPSDAGSLSAPCSMPIMRAAAVPTENHSPSFLAVICLIQYLALGWFFCGLAMEADFLVRSYFFLTPDSSDGCS